MSPLRDPSAPARRPAVRLAIGFTSAVVALCFAGLASAGSQSDLSSLLDPQAQQNPFRADASPSAAPSGRFGVLSGDWQSQNLLGDMGGMRPALANYGVTLSILENVETFGNLSGGVRQGFEANGLMTATVQVDTQKAFGLPGGLLNVSGLHIWGGNLSANNLLSMEEVSDIEAPVGFRLWELWWQQKFGDKFDIKIGEQSLDEEFILSPSAYFFINAASGWPTLASVDLPGGGPAYPLAGLGIRGRAQVTDSLAVLAGVYNGSPIPKNSPNTPASNPYGVSFPLNTGVFAIAELQFSVGSNTTANGPLSGVYKLGAWWDSYRFDDLRYDSAGAPLASPLSNSVAARHRGDFSLYAIMDQTIWRSKRDANRSLSVFVRPMFTPFEDRNLVSASLNAGLNLHGPFAGRENDIFGLELGVARISSGASGYDRDLQFYRPGIYTPARSAEAFLEATYLLQVAPFWQIQPDLQYVVNPGAGIANFNDPKQRVGNELVIGLRTNVTF